MKDYEKIGKKYVEINVLRDLLGVPQGKYSGMNMFQKRVLNVAVEEINEKTNISVSYELERKGRKVLGVWLIIKGKEQSASKDEQEAEIRERLL